MSLAFITGGSCGFSVQNLVIDPASVAAATSAQQTFTLAGLKITDFVQAVKPSLTAGIGVVGSRVSASDTLAITFMNATAAAVDPPSETWRILILRPE